mmetsp:Transcript_32275/g.74316  ORF Transcript_32275/g.74316 Transcript_32275/m.74316 type:complete len:201 (-) Transcript_32275:307-909(-)
MISGCGRCPDASPKTGCAGRCICKNNVPHILVPSRVRCGCDIPDTNLSPSRKFSRCKGSTYISDGPPRFRSRLRSLRTLRDFRKLLKSRSYNFSRTVAIPRARPRVPRCIFLRSSGEGFVPSLSTFRERRPRGFPPFPHSRILSASRKTARACRAATDTVRAVPFPPGSNFFRPWPRRTFFPSSLRSVRGSVPSIQSRRR